MLKYLDEDFVREVIDRRYDVALSPDRRECRSEVVLVRCEGRNCTAESAQSLTKLDVTIRITTIILSKGDRIQGPWDALQGGEEHLKLVI